MIISGIVARSPTNIIQIFNTLQRGFGLNDIQSLQLSKVRVLPPVPRFHSRCAQGGLYFRESSFKHGHESLMHMDFSELVPENRRPEITFAVYKNAFEANCKYALDTSNCEF